MEVPLQIGVDCLFVCYLLTETFESFISFYHSVFLATRIRRGFVTSCRACYVMSRTDARGGVKTRHDTCRIGSYYEIISGFNCL